MNFVETCLYYFCFYGGPFAAKLGQIFSARNDLFSSELTGYLKELQSEYQVSSFRPGDLDLDKLPPGITDINFHALKAGTICVVLRCKYKGEDAVIKIVKKGVEKKLADTFYWMLQFLWLLSFVDPCNLYQRMSELKKTFLQQTDLIQEAQNQTIWHEQYANNDLGVPSIFCYNKYAICMEYIPNHDDQIRELSPEDQRKHALSLYKAVYHSVYVLGKVHSDLHPGNIVFNGSIFVIIDFGWCVDLDREQRRQNILFGLALKGKDYAIIAERICSMYFSDRTDLTKDLEQRLKKSRLCDRQHTATTLSRVLGQFCYAHKLTLATAGSATESAMMNIDGMLPYLFSDVQVDDIRSETLTQLQGQFVKVLM